MFEMPWDEDQASFLHNSGSVMGPSSETINASVTQLVRKEGDIFELQYLGNY